MAFFVASNGSLSKHEFDYLDNITGRRLEVTLAPGKRRVERADASPDSWVVEIMTKEVISFSPTDFVSKAIDIFKNKAIHHIPLLVNDILVGMVSDRDIMWTKHFDIADNVKLEEYMSKVLVVCDEDTPIDYLAHVFVNEKISAMPVINNDGHLAGIVTHHDLLRWIYDK